MDLAEIRKKARGEATVASSSRKGHGDGPAAPIQSSAQPKAPPLPEKSSPAAGQALRRLDREEALEALFRTPLDDGPLTEGQDLQLLQREEAARVEQRQLLTFTLGAEDYALDIESVREIIKPKEITDIPRVPDFILGIISLRGIIIPVFDLRRRLKLGTGGMTPTTRIIVCQQEEKIIGMLVDSICQVIRIPISSIEPPPAVLAGIDRDMVEGVGRYQGRMTILLRLSCVMDAELI